MTTRPAEQGASNTPTGPALAGQPPPNQPQFMVIDYIHTDRGLWSKTTPHRGSYAYACQLILNIIGTSSSPASWRMSVCGHTKQHFKVYATTNDRVLRVLAAARL